MFNSNTPYLDKYTTNGDYDKFSQGNLPAETTSSNNAQPWYNSAFGALGTVGSAYFNSQAPNFDQLEQNRKDRNSMTLIVLAVVVIGVIIYFKSKK